MNKVVNIEDFREIVDIIKERFGNKFVFGYIIDDKFHTFISDELTDIEHCYMADTINRRREE